MDTTAYYNILLEKLLTGSVDDLIRVGAEFINQSIVLLDPSYKVLASWPHRKIGDPYWDAQQEFGFVPEDNLHKVFEARCPDATFQGPTYITWNDVVFPRSAASIQFNGMLLGHISVYHTDSAMSREDIQAACSCLEHVLKIFLTSSNSSVSAASSTVMSALVSRVFTGQHIDSLFRDEWKRLCGEELAGGFVVAAISPQSLHKSILDLLSTRLVNVHKYFAYAEFEKYGYILFYNISSQQHMQSITSKLGDYLHGYKLHCGISDLFENIDEVIPHMYQSRKAFELGLAGADGSLLHVYSQLRSDIVLSYVCKNMEVKNYIHPLFLALQSEDRANGTQYYRTLSVYLDCICDSAKAAKMLFIHRNTLLYRINHIEENYGCSMDDEKFVRDLLLSHMVCSFAQSKRGSDLRNSNNSL